MDNIKTIRYGVSDNEDYRVLKVKDESGKTKIKKYKSLIDNWKGSKMPHEFLYFEKEYLKCVAAYGKSKNTIIEFERPRIPANVMNRIMEELKK